ncbi:Haloacid dehalogenase-like hydrolase-domain-containing protein [Mycena rosella]|uniref:Haloacid dehalogenase-like hydrolase-domain-containing protein n=1 Tax=Mycena rosella TaxID=1033263 RepID=A0AAD7DZU5_MYCRO|nr:Haloacid dehalogenase-like hydrolase-domain-containing protein [Mycena rosella]
MSQTQSFNTIIFDIGDVLFSWSSDTKTSISSRTLRQILTCPTWFNYERGNISEDVCYDRVGAEFSLAPEEIRQAFIEARESLQSNDDLITLVRELKEQSNGTLRIFAMSNISIPDYKVLRTKAADWDIFDRIFTSGEAGERKPHLGFYKHVLSETGIESQRAIFVDDKLENVVSARSLGLHGIVFPRGGSDKVKRALRNLIGDPVLRGRDYLQRNAGALQSVTDNGIVLQENFAQLLILELTGDRDLVNIVEHPRAWNFFHEKGILTTEVFPFDLDTTSIGLTVMKRDKDVVNSVMDEMLQYIDSDGIVLTYFDHQRPRFDPVVCVNVLNLFYAYNRGAQLQSTLQWVCEVLRNRAYLEGTRYYETAECFLYFVSRLLLSCNDTELHATLGPLLKERLQERVGGEGDALQLAMRIVACASLDVRDEVDLRTLLGMQAEDGSWEGWIYKYGSSGIKIGNRGLTTALAIKAVEAAEASSPSPTIVSHSPDGLEAKRPVECARQRLSFSTLRRHSISAPISSADKGQSPRSFRPLRKAIHRLYHGLKVHRSVEVGF